MSRVPVLSAATGDRRVTTDVADACLEYVLSSRKQFRFSKDDSFEITRLITGSEGSSHVRLRQVYRGIPVLGGELIVHSRDSMITFINGNVIAGIDLDVQPAILPCDAMEIGRSWFRNHVAGVAANLDFVFERQENRLFIFTTKDNRAHLAYRVIFYTELQHGIGPGRWNVFVDAADGEVLFALNTIDALDQASGPGGTPNHPHEWVQELDVEETGTPGVYEMDTDRLRTTDMNNGTSGQGTTVTGPLVGIGDEAINDAHGYTEIALLMFEEMGHPNSIDDNGFKLISRVHYDSGYDNAFWDGTQMTYGDGATLFWHLSGALDVIAHEISHGFTEFHSGLEYWSESGGMNESFSDIGGTVAEFVYEGAGADLTMGEDISQEGTALRWMCDPTLDGNSIDHYDDFDDWIDVHYSAGIMNKAFCRIARRYATGDPEGQETVDSVKRVGRAFFKANDAYWVASSTFEQGCQGVMAAAEELGHSEQERDWIEESFLDVGVWCYGEPLSCDQTFTADSGQFSTPDYPNDYPDDYSYIWCIEPGGGKEATLTFDDFATEANYDYVWVYDANENLLSQTSGSLAPPDATSTKLFVRFESDVYVTERGFLASWTSSGGLSCDETFTASSGQFSSPDHPDNYPSDYEHTWCIEPGGGQEVVLSFIDFETESGADFVTVYDENMVEIGSFSGSALPPMATSTKFYIHFESSATVNASGFLAEWYPPLEDGEDCSDPEMCQSGYCVDGVCCGSPCSGTCLACNVPGHVGECHPQPGGTACGDTGNSECSDPDTCDGAGNCLPNHASQGAACGNQGIECLADDTCDGNGNCTDNGYLAQGAACGDASDSECSDPDSCDGAGNCLPNHASQGAACGDQGIECLADDTCDGNGNCTDKGYLAQGAACGDSSDSECSDPDSCDGAGNCLPNHASQGAACGDQGVECLADDTCDGNGNCTDKGCLAQGVSCGDSSDSECSDPDSCDGAGNCLPNDASQGAACGDQGIECLADDTCDGNGNCTDKGYMAQGAACGDSSDSECSGPDSCDGAGNCLPNHASQGAACGDQGVECLADDTCDGNGNCTDNGYLAQGAACGDASDSECSDPDSCDGAGNCLPNHTSDGTHCSANGLFCDGEEICEQGICSSPGDPCTSAETCDEDADACIATCGNGTITGNEECDDENTESGDGCSAECLVEDGWTCSGEPSQCGRQATCGDGAIEGAEECDDGNNESGDGCSADCGVEEDWLCSGEPSLCEKEPDGGCACSSPAGGKGGTFILLLVAGLLLAAGRRRSIQ